MAESPTDKVRPGNPQPGKFLHFPFRVYSEGGKFVATCDPLRVTDRGNTEEQALAKLARSLQLYLRISFSKDSMGVLMEKLMKASPKRPLVNSSSTDPAAFKVDRDASELLVPLAVADTWEWGHERERGGPARSMLD
jgi:predicted RNase H-like HicB family nuclease